MNRETGSPPEDPLQEKAFGSGAVKAVSHAKADPEHRDTRGPSLDNPFML